MKTSILSFIYRLLFLLLILTAAGCSDSVSTTDEQTQVVSEDTDTSVSGESSDEEIGDSLSDSQTGVISEGAFDISEIPEYTDSAYIEVNGSIPFFSADELTTESFESYSDLDSLGRCGVAFACIGTDLMPTEERGSIGSIRPSGWHTVKYNGIDGNYLYNRCHLIGYQLSGENANEENLITGTRYLNTEGMLPFENEVADYVEETENHVMYRVTPVFEDDNLVASGVLIEAWSVEDDGEGISFCVYCYNVQPGIEIDYETGDSEGPAYTGSTSDTSSASSDTASEETAADSADDLSDVTYIGNANTMKFHSPDCSSVDDIADHNKVYFYGTRDEAIAAGYEACKRCNP